MLLVTVLPVVGTMSASRRVGDGIGVWGLGGYTEGYTGVLPSHCKAEHMTAKRAP